MKLLHKLLKLLLLMIHILLGMGLAVVLFSPRLPLVKRWRTTVVQMWSQRLCRLCGLQINCSGQIASAPTLFVANHISWLDIFALLATFPMTFVAKQEVARWPVIGWLVQRVGTLFIARGQFRAAAEVSARMTTALGHQTNILFFPEGTSTRGDMVKRFHARLFQAAIETEAWVQPIALRYPHEAGLNPSAPYVDDDNLFNHLWQILEASPLSLEICFCTPISAQHQKRRELAEYARAEIMQVLKPYQQSELHSFNATGGRSL
ncbi:MAG: lysophospholipid acyltransferase family protein [Pseudomonadota bacterium]|nr:lysophospholipid acyltransferase family protein [Pseudomonadota bacterium]